MNIYRFGSIFGLCDFILRKNSREASIIASRWFIGFYYRGPANKKLYYCINTLIHFILFQNIHRRIKIITVLYNQIGYFLIQKTL